MPMLAVTKVSRPETANGAARRSSTFWATGGAFSGDARSPRMTTNSSPLMRATVSPLRTQASRRRATSFSSSSPAAWPCMSFTSLK
jgi:hypothetical protein